MVETYDFIATLPGLVLVKDSHSKFLGMSPDFATLAGWKTSEECIGKTDHDIPCKAAEFADEFIKTDKKVFDSGVKMLTLDVQHYSSGLGLILAERNPMKNQHNEIIGLYDHCINVTTIHQFKAYLMLHQLDSKLHGKNFKPITYILDMLHCPLLLTERQENCLFLLIRRKTTKQIGKLLQISPRTVECHIEAIKTKFKCQSISDIIEKAFDSGFLYYIPKSFQKNELENILSET